MVSYGIYAWGSGRQFKKTWAPDVISALWAASRKLLWWWRWMQLRITVNISKRTIINHKQFMTLYSSMSNLQLLKYAQTKAKSNLAGCTKCTTKALSLRLAMIFNTIKEGRSLYSQNIFETRGFNTMRILKTSIYLLDFLRSISKGTWDLLRTGISQDLNKSCSRGLGTVRGRVPCFIIWLCTSGYQIATGIGTLPHLLYNWYLEEYSYLKLLTWEFWVYLLCPLHDRISKPKGRF